MTYKHQKTVLSLIPKLKTKTINKNRFYVTPEGNEYPSITTVLSIRNKKGLVEWRKRVGNDVANYVAGKAAARGTKVHHMCEDYLNNEDINHHQKDFLPWCIFTQLKNKVLCIKGVDEVDVQLVWDPPWGNDMMSDGAKLELGMM